MVLSKHGTHYGQQSGFLCCSLKADTHLEVTTYLQSVDTEWRFVGLSPGNFHKLPAEYMDKYHIPAVNDRHVIMKF